MATNFEFYKNRLKAGFKREYVSKCLTEAIEEATEVKIHKRCGEECAQCVLNTIEWLLAEHTEQPKLTKRERAFCEAAQTGRIARDRDGSLCWYPDDAVVQKSRIMWNSEKYVCISRFKLQFLCIKWSDEKPWSIEDLLKLEVE